MCITKPSHTYLNDKSTLLSQFHFTPVLGILIYHFVFLLINLISSFFWGVKERKHFHFFSDLRNLVAPEQGKPLAIDYGFNIAVNGSKLIVLKSPMDREIKAHYELGRG